MKPSDWRSYSPGGAVLVLWDRVFGTVARFGWTLCAKFLLRLVSATYGKGLCADGRLVVRATSRQSIRLGDRVTFLSRFTSNLVGLTGPSVLQCYRTGRIEIGDGTGCSGVVISSRSQIRIGRNVKIGGNVRIFDHDFHSLDPAARRDSARDAREARTKPVVIGDDVFIGAQAIILKGVTIGDRSIIGAGSVVALKEIPPDSVVAGNPARLLQRGGVRVSPIAP